MKGGIKMVTKKCWIKRNLSDFERRNYAVEKYTKIGDPFKQIIISKSAYGDIDVITPTKRMSAINIADARRKARAYMKKNC